MTSVHGGNTAGLIIKIKQLHSFKFNRIYQCQCVWLYVNAKVDSCIKQHIHNSCNRREGLANWNKNMTHTTLHLSKYIIRSFTPTDSIIAFKYFLYLLWLSQIMSSQDIPRASLSSYNATDMFWPHLHSIVQLVIYF